MEEEKVQSEEPVEEIIDAPETTEKPLYVPRPAWQVWAARIGLVIVIIAVILYYWHIASGGKL